MVQRRVYTHIKTNERYLVRANVQIKMPDQGWVDGILYDPLDDGASLRNLEDKDCVGYIRLTTDFEEKFK